MSTFSDDATFLLNAAGTGIPGLGGVISRKAALTAVMQQLIANFHFTNWREISFLADGEQGALHWSADVTFTANNQTQSFDVVDLITVRDGKIATMIQTTDSAKIANISALPRA